jgi:hypothetical protein
MSTALAEDKRVALYPWQADALQRCRPHGDTRWFAWFCGTGAGKSFAGGLWFLAQMMAAANRARAAGEQQRVRGLLIAPTLATLRRHMIDPLMEATKDTAQQPRFVEQRGELYFPAAAGGGVAITGSFDNKDSVKRADSGQYDVAWHDECCRTPDTAYAVLRARTAFRRGAILLSGYWEAPINWCYREIWKRWEAGDREVDVINLPTESNPAYPREEIEAARRTLDSALFEMRYGGKPTRMVGLVYGESWDSANKTIHCEPFDIPDEFVCSLCGKQDRGADPCRCRAPEFKWAWDIHAGLDQGYSPHPFRLELNATELASGITYAFGEYGSLATTTHEKAVGITRLMRRVIPRAARRHYRFYGDPSNAQGLADLQYELKSLDEQRDGVAPLDIKVLPGDNAVEPGIETMNAALRNGTFRVMRGRCPLLIEEFGLYCRDSNGTIVKDDDHSLDAERYDLHTRKRRQGRKLVYT